MLAKAPHLKNIRPPEKPFSLAISIDESISICPIKIPINRNQPPGFFEPPYIKLFQDSDDKMEVTSQFIRTFCKDFNTALADVGSIVISSIGLVDMIYRRVERIVRPGWSNSKHIWPWELDIFLQDSSEKILPLIRSPWRGPDCRFKVINDATAGAIGEFWHIIRGRDREDVKALMGRPFVYIRVGEGINAGIVVKGQPWRGGLHPELGHMYPRVHPEDLNRVYSKESQQGVCEVHRTCYEGIASKAALREKLGTHDIHNNEKEMDIEAYYIAQLCQTATVMLAPGRIVLGGSLVNEDMVARVKNHFYVLINGYPKYDELYDRTQFLTRAKLLRSNLTGAGHLAHSIAIGGDRVAPLF